MDDVGRRRAFDPAIVTRIIAPMARYRKQGLNRDLAVDTNWRPTDIKASRRPLEVRRRFSAVRPRAPCRVRASGCGSEAGKPAVWMNIWKQELREAH